MSFEWPYDKLGVVNACLAQTGSRSVASADDGSEEWKAASPAYEIGLAFACESHPWNWTTEWRTLNPSPTVPADTRYDKTYPLPGNLVHLIMVRLNDVPCQWDFLNKDLIVRTQGSSATTVLVKGIFSTNSDATNATPMVVMALQYFTMSGIYRGLKKDLAEANRMFGLANGILEKAKSRHDMQKPKAAIFKSRMTMVRRGRKPWYQTPDSGTPN